MQNPKVRLTFFVMWVIVIIFNSGCNSSIAESDSNNLASANCREGVVIVEQSSDPPAQLSVREAKCGDFQSNVKLELKNVSNKSITGYEISTIQDYENKKGSKSAQGLTGGTVILKPGETKEIVDNGGITSGTSYGKPVGKLQRVTFRVSFIDFNDGTRWIHESSAH